MKVSKWAVIGSVWTAWWLFIMAWVVIADWPNHAQIWQVYSYAGFLWEIFTIALMWFVGYVLIWISALLGTINKMLRGFLLMWEKTN